MQSYYEINVTYVGRHYFATAPRSLTDLGRAQEVYEDLIERFPRAEGFRVTVVKWESCGTSQAWGDSHAV